MKASGLRRPRLGAIETLYDDRERPRVFGLFALVWLLPSVVGPPLNAVITDWIDWRWALAWPGPWWSSPDC